DTPYMGVDEGWELYNFVLRHRPRRCLELGHAHGSSSLYIAAALDEIGGGHLDSVDLRSSVDRVPNIEMLFAEARLTRYLSIYREQNSYTWFLKRKIEEQSSQGRCDPCYDFCFVDGCKNWTIDGLAFFLVEKLLCEDAWILFDDYRWTYARHQHKLENDGITTRSLSAEEMERAHVELIFHLLVMQHEKFSNFVLQDGAWAWAQKQSGGSRALQTSQKLPLPDDLAASSPATT
ncbi:MAG: class I SAM-dependent methyltransferase, partial [Gammaproteobacteria bacterium]|nr:class I SAM-dependent methyltransferase [Gammaproteobacteria bacterium]